MAGRWEENKHPRDNDGKFTEKEENGYEKEYAEKVLKQEQTEKGVTGNHRDSYDTLTGEIKKKNFINITLFLAKDYSTWRVTKMKKSIRTLKKRIAEHENKIKNAPLLYPEWKTFSEERKEREFRSWKKEIRNFTRDIERMEKELKKRGEL